MTPEQLHHACHAHYETMRQVARDLAETIKSARARYLVGDDLEDKELALLQVEKAARDFIDGLIDQADREETVFLNNVDTYQPKRVAKA